MKILSLEFENLETLKGRWKLDLLNHRSQKTACLLLRVQPVRVKLLFWMRFAWRYFTAHLVWKVSRRDNNELMTRGTGSVSLNLNLKSAGQNLPF